MGTLLLIAVAIIAFGWWVGGEFPLVLTILVAVAVVSLVSGMSKAEHTLRQTKALEELAAKSREPTGGR
jgi:hypothetical protein